MRVFLGSPFRGLEDLRQKVHDLIAQHHEVVWMEDFGSQEVDTLDACLRAVENCDAYLLLIGHHYGSYATPDGYSYTHLEYERARASRVPVLAYVQAGFMAATSASEDGESARSFWAQVRSALTMETREFSDAAGLGESILRDLQSLATRSRPVFGRSKAAIADPLLYSAGASRHELLKLKSFKIVLVDLSVLEADGYPSKRRGRVAQKMALIRSELENEGAQVIIFNNLPVDRRADVAKVRARAANEEANAIVCFAPAPKDQSRLSLFLDAHGEVFGWYPEWHDLRFGDDRILIRPYTDEDLSTCDLAARVTRTLRDRLDRHLVSATL